MRVQTLKGYRMHPYRNELPERPERILAGGFLLMILAGGILLSLPCACAGGKSVGLRSAFFTAASAVCVTGLVAVDTGSTFSLFGQLVILALIQIGGLGFMVFATMAMAVLGRRVSLRGRILLRESMNASGFSDLARLSCLYGAMAFAIELCGAALLSLRFVPAYGWSKGVYFSLWHAVSAFCNAGFDLFGGYASLTIWQHDAWVLTVISVLILSRRSG